MWFGAGLGLIISPTIASKIPKKILFEPSLPLIKEFIDTTSLYFRLISEIGFSIPIQNITSIEFIGRYQFSKNISHHKYGYYNNINIIIGLVFNL